MLLERETELAVLRDQILGLPSMGGKVVLIRGEAGIGKSALVSAFIASFSADVDVFEGACDDLFVQQALAPFWDIARDEPTIQEPLHRADRFRLFSAVLALLSRSERPTVLVIEDTQWADEATLDAIRYLGRRIARTNGLLVLTFRDGDVGQDHPLRSVLGDLPAASVVQVQPSALSLDAVTRLIGPSGLEPSGLLAATRGNPFLVTQMVSAGGTVVPASLRDAVMAQVRRLSVLAQGVVKTLAVIPGPILVADALHLDGIDEVGLDECEARGLLERRSEAVTFRHELIRRVINASLTAPERIARCRVVIRGLPTDTNPSLLLDCASGAGDVEKILELAPRSARYAAATGSHLEAAGQFRMLRPYFDRLAPQEAGPLLDEWAVEEFLLNEVHEAIRLNGLARHRYRQAADRAAESRALSRAAHYHEIAGLRKDAEELARLATDVLGPEPDGAALAQALEVDAYLQVMANNVDAVPGLVDRALAAGGPAIDARILIRCLNHRGMATDTRHYPAGKASLDEARRRATEAGEWFEEARALLNHARGAVEWVDLPVAYDYTVQAVASAVRHELPAVEGPCRGMYARVLELRGDWSEAADEAREVLVMSPIAQMVARPVLAVLEARRGRPSARETVARAWEMASVAVEIQRLSPAACAAAEYAWISGETVLPVEDVRDVMGLALELGFAWSGGRIAYWLWELGELSEPPDGIAEPYQRLMGGDVAGAADIWQARGVPYEHALALAHGGHAERATALEELETLGASATAARLRRRMRASGLQVPRGRGRAARRNIAGLTARQAEVLLLLEQGLTNTEIADRLFLSPRTVENHVSAVLDKLDVSSREEAGARARADRFLST